MLHNLSLKIILKEEKNSNFASVTCEYVVCYAKNSSSAFFKENIPKPERDMRLDENGNYVHASGRRVIMGENNFNKIVSNFDSDKHYSLYINKLTQEYTFKKESKVDEIDIELTSSGFDRFISYRENNFVENTYTKNKMETLLKDKAVDIVNDKIYEKILKVQLVSKILLLIKIYRYYKK